jgi:hypothetical protein
MKLRLDYFLSIGGETAIGDGFIGCDGDSYIIEGDDGDDFSDANDPDNVSRFITSFAPRKSKGEQPCGDDMPVVVNWHDGVVENTTAGWVSWDNSDIDDWSFCLEALIKMQAEHDTKKAEPVKPRVKVEYVPMVTSHPYKMFKAMEDDGDVYVLCEDGEYEGMSGCVINLANAIGDETSIYRKVETEVTWRSEVEEFIVNATEGMGSTYIDASDGDVVIDGRIPADDFVKMCHLVTSLTK